MISIEAKTLDWLWMSIFFLLTETCFQLLTDFGIETKIWPKFEIKETCRISDTEVSLCFFEAQWVFEKLSLSLLEFSSSLSCNSHMTRQWAVGTRSWTLSSTPIVPNVQITKQLDRTRILQLKFHKKKILAGTGFWTHVLPTRIFLPWTRNSMIDPFQ